MSNHNKKDQLLKIAKSLINKPYKYGAALDEAPHVFDCSSLTQHIFKEIGIDIPRSSVLQAADSRGQEIQMTANFSNLETGDLLFMRSTRGYYNDELFSDRKIAIGHVAIYIDDNKIIHARSSINAVAEQELQDLTKDPNYKIVLVKRFF